jgi:CubicO group peptidase (beta-lactamase class C family)
MNANMNRAAVSEWHMSPPDAQDIDTVSLAAAYDQAARLPALHSLLVARHGVLVVERYYGHFNAGSIFNIKSASKCVLSALIGIAHGVGILPDLDRPIEAWFPEYFTAQADPRKHRITLRHLLTMNAGLAWIENAGTVRRWRHSEDWARFVLDTPMLSEPGRQFTYNTGLTHLAAVILARASGMSALAFAEQRLFGPLGIHVARWKTDPQGYYVGGTDICLTARDMATFGQLFLQQGQWGERSLVAPEWVAESTRPQISLRQRGFWHPAYTDYGYFWWLRQMGGHAAAVASGYGGQLIFVIPALDLVVVTTADAEVPFSAVMKQSNEIEDMIESFVIPSIQEVHSNGTTHR